MKCLLPVILHRLHSLEQGGSMHFPALRTEETEVRWGNPEIAALRAGPAQGAPPVITENAVGSLIYAASPSNALSFWR